MRSVFLVLLFVCLYAATVLAAEHWTQPLTGDEQVLFALLNAKRLENGFPVMQLDGLLLGQVRSGQGVTLTATSLGEAVEKAQPVIAVLEVSRVGLKVVRSKDYFVVTLVAK
ncbi:MAG: hypothetical protein GX766_08470 [Firmicutes bacterium]|jgi:hypothetical protein|nr:hypothetical protein [Bacillota bacterium]HOB21692.1 hypothetical protein [Bacillota bacterium]